MILYHMLTRKMPFEAPTFSQMVRNVIAVARRRPLPRYVRISVRPGALDVRQMARDRDQRFATVGEAIDALKL